MTRIFLITLLFFNFFITESFAQKVNYNSSEYDDEFEQYDKEFGQKNQVEIYDPLEKVNRKIFAFNETLDIHLIEPIARAYHNYVHDRIRLSLRNFTINLTLPLSGINSLAQGKVDNALATFSNFLINSTIGAAGLFDIASYKNIYYEREDFGQTLGNYGLNNGPYLVLPLFGPSNARDFTGLAMTWAIDPTSFNTLKIGGSSDAIDVEYRYANSIILNLGTREALLTTVDDLRRDSFDLYATYRSLYTQQRDTLIQR